MNRFSISFVLPMYNERDAIEYTLEEIRIIAEAITDDYEIIVSDDGSTDGCGELVKRISKKMPAVRLVSLEKNTKFGGALAKGLESATKELIVYTDSDLPISLLDIKKALPLIENCDIVQATSMIKKGENIKRKVISWGYNFLLRVLFGINIKDVNSGFKIFRADVLKGMKYISKSPFVDAEIFIKAGKRGARIVEFPLIFRPRRQGESSVSRLSIIFQTFSDMLRFRFSSG